MDEVVITGIGAISCNGNDTESCWTNILNGRDGYKNSYLDIDNNFQFKPVGKIKNFNPQLYLTKAEERELDRASQLGLIAASLALKDSKINLRNIEKDEVAVVMGTTCGTNLSIEDRLFLEKWYAKETKTLSGTVFKKYNHVDLPNAISKKFNFQGPSFLVGTACAAGTHAIGEAFELIRLGNAKIVFCGGADSLSILPLIGFNSTRALARTCCATFDKTSKGIVLGEGAGVLILESLKNAKARGAKIYAKISGWASNCDAENITMPIADGTRSAQLIQDCLKKANLLPNQIDYLSAHGTGTLFNDIMEVNGIKKSFNGSAKDIYVSSIKTMIGHTLGAAGAIEGVISALCIRDNRVPPNINLSEPREGFDLKFVTNTNQNQKVDHVLSLSFGFGGCNMAIIFSSLEIEETR